MEGEKKKDKKKGMKKKKKKTISNSNIKNLFACQIKLKKRERKERGGG